MFLEYMDLWDMLSWKLEIFPEDLLVMVSLRYFAAFEVDFNTFDILSALDSPGFSISPV